MPVCFIGLQGQNIGTILIWVFRYQSVLAPGILEMRLDVFVISSRGSAKRR
jgi:hypothetical protein